jgi:hypothetical protein
MLGLALFGLSMFQPMITLVDVTPPPFNDLRIVFFLRADFYSYKINYYFEQIEVYSESFNAYWFGHAYLNYSNITFDSFIPIAAFASQISTFLLTLATFRRKTRVRAIPMVSIIATALLTTLFYFSLNSSSIFLNPRLHVSGPRFKWDLTAGYWLTYPSAICVSLSIILQRERSSARRVWG